MFGPYLSRAYRTAICKSKRGGFKDTYADDLLAPVLKASFSPSTLNFCLINGQLRSWWNVFFFPFLLLWIIFSYLAIHLFWGEDVNLGSSYHDEIECRPCSRKQIWIQVKLGILLLEQCWHLDLKGQANAGWQHSMLVFLVNCPHKMFPFFIFFCILGLYIFVLLMHLFCMCCFSWCLVSTGVCCLIFFSETVPVRTVNRQCSSGLQAVADVAAAIKAGFYEIGMYPCFWKYLSSVAQEYYHLTTLFSGVGIGAGLESMTVNPMAWEGSVNPKVLSPYIARFHILLPFSTFFMPLLVNPGKEFCPSPRLPPPNGCYFWKCSTSIWCDEARAGSSCSKYCPFFPHVRFVMVLSYDQVLIFWDLWT